MSFINASTKARLEFARQLKARKVSPDALSVSVEFDADERTCFVYGSDRDDNILVCSTFPLRPEAWHSQLKREIERLFKGSASLAIKGR